MSRSRTRRWVELGSIRLGPRRASSVLSGLRPAKLDSIPFGSKVLGAFVLTTLAVAASGCHMIQGSTPKVTVRPSSQEELADVRVLDKPFTLAAPEDAIVRVVGPTMTCTGTVIDDDLVLTAHHCLVERGSHRK